MSTRDNCEVASFEAVPTTNIFTARSDELFAILPSLLLLEVLLLLLLIVVAVVVVIVSLASS